MYPFVETICLVNKKLRNLKFHNRRMNLTRKLNFGSQQFLDLEEIIQIPENTTNDKYKIRVIYTDQIIDIQIIPYFPISIQTLKIASIDADFDYYYKSTNRKYFAELLSFYQAEDLILTKNNFITDTTFTNLIFFDGKQWFTPLHCLLQGTMRQSLLEKNQIEQRIIKVDDLNDFLTFKRINALIDFDEAEELPIKNIIL